MNCTFPIESEVSVNVMRIVCWRRFYMYCHSYQLLMCVTTFCTCVIVTTIAWGDPSRNFVPKGKLTKKMRREGKFVPGDLQVGRLRKVH